MDSMLWASCFMDSASSLKVETHFFTRQELGSCLKPAWLQWFSQIWKASRQIGTAVASATRSSKYSLGRTCQLWNLIGNAWRLWQNQLSVQWKKKQPHQL